MRIRGEEERNGGAVEGREGGLGGGGGESRREGRGENKKE